MLASDVTVEPCRYCGAFHGPLCPMVRAIEYYRDGRVKRVELGVPPITPAPYVPWYPAHPDIPFGPSPWDVHNPIRITD